MLKCEIDIINYKVISNYQFSQTPGITMVKCLSHILNTIIFHHYLLEYLTWAILTDHE